MRLDRFQFRQIVEELSVGWDDVGLQLLSGLLGALVATYASARVQKQFHKKNVLDKESIDNAYRFNEAVGFFSALIEQIYSTIDQLVFTAYEEEHDRLQTLYTLKRNGCPPTNFTTSWTTIPPLKLMSAESHLSKLPQAGKYVDAIQAFYRMAHEIEAFTKCCQNRDELIEKSAVKYKYPDEIDDIIHTSEAIFQRTELSLRIVEPIFDAALFIVMEKLPKISNEIKQQLKEEKITGIKIANPLKNSFYIETFQRIMELLDENPDYQKRFLHMRAVLKEKYPVTSAAASTN